MEQLIGGAASYTSKNLITIVRHCMDLPQAAGGRWGEPISPKVLYHSHQELEISNWRGRALRAVKTQLGFDLYLTRPLNKGTKGS